MKVFYVAALLLVGLLILPQYESYAKPRPRLTKTFNKAAQRRGASKSISKRKRSAKQSQKKIAKRKKGSKVKARYKAKKRNYQKQKYKVKKNKRISRKIRQGNTRKAGSKKYPSKAKKKWAQTSKVRQSKKVREQWVKVANVRNPSRRSSGVWQKKLFSFQRTKKAPKWDKVHKYRDGTRMNAMTHIMSRHGHNSKASNTSRFSLGTTKDRIKLYVDVAVQYNKREKDGSYIHDFGNKTIGRDIYGKPTSKIRVYLEKGHVKSAYPWSPER